MGDVWDTAAAQLGGGAQAAATPAKGDVWDRAAATAAPGDVWDKAAASVTPDPYIQQQKNEDARLRVNAIRQVFGPGGAVESLATAKARSQVPAQKAKADELLTEAQRLSKPQPEEPPKGGISRAFTAIVNAGPRARGGGLLAQYHDIERTVRAQHPDWSDEQVRQEVVSRRPTDTASLPSFFKGMAHGVTDLSTPTGPEAAAQLAREYPFKETIPNPAREVPLVPSPEEQAAFGHGFEQRHAARMAWEAAQKKKLSETPEFMTRPLSPEKAATEEGVLQFTPVGDPVSPLLGMAAGKVVPPAARAVAGVGRAVGRGVGAAVEAVPPVARAVEKAKAAVTPATDALARFFQGTPAVMRQAARAGAALPEAGYELPPRLAVSSPEEVADKLANAYEKVSPSMNMRLEGLLANVKEMRDLNPQQTQLVHEALSNGSPRILRKLPPADRDLAERAFNHMQRLAEESAGTVKELGGGTIENYVPARATEQAVEGMRATMQRSPPGAPLAPAPSPASVVPRPGQHFKSRELMEKLSGEAGTAIRTAPEANAYIKANPDSEVVSSLRKFAGLKPGEPFYEENLAKLAAQRYTPAAKEEVWTHFLKDHVNDLTVRVPNEMPVPPGYRMVSDLEPVGTPKALRGKGLVARALGADAAVPEPIFNLLNKSFGEKPNSVLQAVNTLGGAWRRMVTVLSGVGYHVRNARTSLELLAGEHGPAKLPLLADDAERILAGSGSTPVGRAITGAIPEGQPAMLRHKLAELGAANAAFDEAQGAGKALPNSYILDELKKRGFAGGTGRPTSSVVQEIGEAAGQKQPWSFPLIGQRGKVTQALGSMAGKTDEFFRAMAIAGELRRGVPLEAAIDRASKLITHTQNLSPAMEAVRQAAPFAPWTMRAAPMQVGQVLRGKGGVAQKIANVYKARAKPETEAAPGLIPDYLKDAQPFPMGRRDEAGRPLYGYDIAGPAQQISILDPLYQAARGRIPEAWQSLGQQVTRQLSPAYGMGVQVATGQKLGGDRALGDLEKASPWVEQATKLGIPMDHLGVVKVGQGRTEKVVAPAWLNMLANELPWSQYARLVQAKTPEEFKARLSSLVGFGYTPVREDAMRYGELQRRVLKPAESLGREVSITRDVGTYPRPQ